MDVCENQVQPRTRTMSRNSAATIRSDLEQLMSEDRSRFSRAVSDPTQNQTQSTDPDQDQSSGWRKPALVRSKTFDNSLLRDTDVEPKIERKKSHYSQLSKTNGHYHKIFKDISKEEHLQQSYTCALQKDILYQGRMFVSEHWICFHSKVFGKDIKIAIPVVSVTNIKKTKTALLLPNALVVSTSSDRYVFVSFLSRDNTYKFLMSLCLHLEEKSPCSSPVPSAIDSRGHRSAPSPHFPLAFSADFVEQRVEEESSSSSDSQTHDYPQINEFPVVSEFLLSRPNKPASPKLSEHLQKIQKNPSPKVQTQKVQVQKVQVQKVQAQVSPGNNGQPEQRKARGVLGVEVVESRSLKVVSLNTLLCVYLLLVVVLLLSSCYLAFKILSLEQKLSTLSPLDFSPTAASEPSPDLVSELITINLMKLEKVQKNLQRLLEEAV